MLIKLKKVLNKINLLKKRMTALKTFLFSKTLRRDFLKLGVKELYKASLLKKDCLPCIDLEGLLHDKNPCKLLPFSRIDGNMSYYELIVLSSLIQNLKPLTLLEIGTFNGLTTLHMAINTPQNALIHTLDLLEIENQTFLDIEDLKYIEHKEKNKKKYRDHIEQVKIQEHYGNSLYYPFEAFQNPNFIFIDGSHSYLMVKNDTEKSLNILKKGGVILWHDYTPECTGVFTYLNELRAHYPIFHIRETSLVYCKL